LAQKKQATPLEKMILGPKNKLRSPPGRVVLGPKKTSSALNQSLGKVFFFLVEQNLGRGGWGLGRGSQSLGKALFCRTEPG